MIANLPYQAVQNVTLKTATKLKSLSIDKTAKLGMIVAFAPKRRPMEFPEPQGKVEWEKYVKKENAAQEKE